MDNRISRYSQIFAWIQNELEAISKTVRSDSTQDHLLRAEKQVAFPSQGGISTFNQVP